MHETLKRPRGRPSSKVRILDAALALVAEVGVNRLTLDAVAERAGVSKGGLLYNYSSKDALLTAMVERFISQCEEHRGAIESEIGPGPQTGLKALLRARGNPADFDRKAAHSMLAAAAENPRMLQSARDAQVAVVNILSSAEDPVGARIAWLALEGLNFLEMLELDPFTAEERAAIVARIMTMADA